MTQKYWTHPHTLGQGKPFPDKIIWYCYLSPEWEDGSICNLCCRIQFILYLELSGAFLNLHNFKSVKLSRKWFASYLFVFWVFCLPDRPGFCYWFSCLAVFLHAIELSLELSYWLFVQMLEVFRSMQPSIHLSSISFVGWKTNLSSLISLIQDFIESFGASCLCQ